MASTGSSCYTPRMHMIRHDLQRFVALTTGILALTAMASAQSRSIYGGGVDEETAMVRLVDAGAAGAVELRLGAVSLATVAPGDATPYRQTVPDIHVITYLGKRYEFMPEPGTFYTLAALADRLLVFEDVRHVDPARAQVYFYNLGANAAELMTADGSSTVAGPCPAGSSAQVAVNPIRITVAAYASRTRLGEPVALRLERGASYSVFACAGPVGPAVFAVKATIE